VAWLYCNHKETAEQTLANLLGCLLKQLMLERSIVPANIQHMYDELSKRLTRPAYSEIIRMLRSEVSNHSEVFLVVDALDECPEDDMNTRSKLLEQLRSLPGNVKLMITSRYLSSIEHDLEGEQRLEIHATSDDIVSYVEGRILEENRLRRHTKSDPSLQSAILETISKSVDGM
jgi:hypothetical protein